MCILLQFFKGEKTISACLVLLMPTVALSCSSCVNTASVSGPHCVAAQMQCMCTMKGSCFNFIFNSNPITSPLLLDSLTPVGIHFLEMESSITAQVADFLFDP